MIFFQGEGAEAPPKRKNQKPSEPPVTFREFDVGFNYKFKAFNLYIKQT